MVFELDGWHKATLNVQTTCKEIWSVGFVPMYKLRIHIWSQNDHTKQGVVTYMSPVEAFATAIKFFDRQKVCLIA